MMLAGRNASFQDGYMSNPGDYPTGIAPTSTLIQYQQSPIATNTSARTEQGRAMYSGQLLPSRNGFAPDTYQKLFTGMPTQVGY